jgi:septal ring-binding cell division protein DamX
MATKRKPGTGTVVRGAAEERRRLIAAGSLSAAALGVLVLGAVLRADAPFDESTVPAVARTLPPADTAAAPVEVASPSVERPSPRRESPPPPRPDPEAGSLEQRAASDPGRLLDGRGSYTLQLIVSCDPDNARRHLDLLEASARLFVLPVELDGKDCYRLCWGRYDTRNAAATAADVPAAFDSPRVKAIAELAP